MSRNCYSRSTFKLHRNTITAPVASGRHWINALNCTHIHRTGVVAFSVAACISKWPQNQIRQRAHTSQETTKRIVFPFDMAARRFSLRICMQAPYPLDCILGAGICSEEKEGDGAAPPLHNEIIQLRSVGNNGGEN